MATLLEVFDAFDPLADDLKHEEEWMHGIQTYVDLSMDKHVISVELNDIVDNLIAANPKIHDTETYKKVFFSIVKKLSLDIRLLDIDEKFLFYENILLHLVSRMEVADKLIRMQCCLFMTECITHYSDLISISGKPIQLNICLEDVINVLLKAAKDSIFKIRVLTIKCLQTIALRFPEFSLTEQIKTVILERMSDDSSMEVRIESMKFLFERRKFNDFLDKDDIFCLLERLRDVSVQVRLQVLPLLEDSPFDLSGEEKHYVVECIVRDRECLFTKAGMDLLQTWVQKRYNFDIVDFVKELMPFAQESMLAKLVSFFLIESAISKDVGNKLFICCDEQGTAIINRFSSPAASLVWKIALQAWKDKSSKYEKDIIEAFPSMTELAEAIDDMFMLLQNLGMGNSGIDCALTFEDASFILKQMLVITHFFADEYRDDIRGARLLKDAVNRIMQSDVVEEELGSLAFKTLAMVTENDTETVELLLTALKVILLQIAVAKAGATPAPKKHHESNKTKGLGDDDEATSVEENNEGIAYLKLRIMTLGSSFFEMMIPKFRAKATISDMDPGFLELQEILTDVTMSCIASVFPVIRYAAVKSFGLLHLREKILFQGVQHFFVDFAQQDGEEIEIRDVALKCLFDYLLWHSSGDDPLLGNMMFAAESSCQQLRMTAITGFCKICLLQLTANDGVLMCLICYMFHEAFANDYELKQCLTDFFPRYVEAMKINKNSFPLLSVFKLLLSAYSNEPNMELNELPVAKILNYIIYLAMTSQSNEILEMISASYEVMSDNYSGILKAIVNNLQGGLNKYQQYAFHMGEALTILDSSSLEGCSSLHALVEAYLKLDEIDLKEADIKFSSLSSFRTMLPEILLEKLPRNDYDLILKIVKEFFNHISYKSKEPRSKIRLDETCNSARNSPPLKTKMDLNASQLPITMGKRTRRPPKGH